MYPQAASFTSSIYSMALTNSVLLHTSKSLIWGHSSGDTESRSNIISLIRNAHRNIKPQKLAIGGSNPMDIEVFEILGLKVVWVEDHKEEGQPKEHICGSGRPDL